MDYILPLKKGDELTIEIKQGMVFDPQKFKEELENLKQAGFLFGKKADRAGFLALLCQTFGYSTEDIDPVLAGTSDGFDKVVDDVLDKTAGKLAVEVPVSEIAFSTNVEADPPEGVRYGGPVEEDDETLEDHVKVPVFLSDLDDNLFEKKRKKLRRSKKKGGSQSENLTDETDEDDDDPEEEIA